MYAIDFVEQSFVFQCSALPISSVDHNIMEKLNELQLSSLEMNMRRSLSLEV